MNFTEIVPSISKYKKIEIRYNYNNSDFFILFLENPQGSCSQNQEMQVFLYLPYIFRKFENNLIEI